MIYLFIVQKRLFYDDYLSSYFSRDCVLKFLFILILSTSFLFVIQADAFLQMGVRMDMETMVAIFKLVKTNEKN